MSVEIRRKAIVSVAEMARMSSLSRARFYQLVKVGVFPLAISVSNSAANSHAHPDSQPPRPTNTLARSLAEPPRP